MFGSHAVSIVFCSRMAAFSDISSALVRSHGHVYCDHQFYNSSQSHCYPVLIRQHVSHAGSVEEYPSAEHYPWFEPCFLLCGSSGDWSRDADCRARDIHTLLMRLYFGALLEHFHPSFRGGTSSHAQPGESYRRNPRWLHSRLVLMGFCTYIQTYIYISSQHLSPCHPRHSHRLSRVPTWLPRRHGVLDAVQGLLADSPCELVLG